MNRPTSAFVGAAFLVIALGNVAATRDPESAVLCLLFGLLSGVWFGMAVRRTR